MKKIELTADANKSGDCSKLSSFSKISSRFREKMAKKEPKIFSNKNVPTQADTEKTKSKTNNKRNAKRKLKNATRGSPPTLAKKPSEVEMKVFVCNQRDKESIVEHSTNFSGPHSAENFDRLSKKRNKRVFDKFKGLFRKRRNSKQRVNIGMFAFKSGQPFQKSNSADIVKVKKQMKTESKMQNKTKKRLNQPELDQERQDLQDQYFETVLTSAAFPFNVSKTGDEITQKFFNNYLGENTKSKSLEDILNYINELNGRKSQKSKNNPGGEPLRQQLDFDNQFLGLKTFMKRNENASRTRKHRLSVHSSDSQSCLKQHQSHKQYREALQKLDNNVEHGKHGKNIFIPFNKADISSDASSNINYFMLDRKTGHKKMNSIIYGASETANNNKQIMDWYLEDCSKPNKNLLASQVVSHKLLNINSSNSPNKMVLKSKEAKPMKSLNSNFSLNYSNQSQILTANTKSKSTVPNNIYANQSDEDLFRPNEPIHQMNENTNVEKDSQKCDGNFSSIIRPDNSDYTKNKNISVRPNVMTRAKFKTQAARSSSIVKRENFISSRNSPVNRKVPVALSKIPRKQKSTNNEKSFNECIENNWRVNLSNADESVKGERQQEGAKVEPLKNKDDTEGKRKNIQKNIQGESDQRNLQEFVLDSSSIGTIRITKSPSNIHIGKLSNQRSAISVNRRKTKKIMFSESVKRNHESMTSIIKLKSSPKFENSKTIQSDLDDDYEISDRKSNTSPNNAKYIILKRFETNRSKEKLKINLGRGQNLRTVRSFTSRPNNRPFANVLSRNSSACNYYRRLTPPMEAQNLFNNRIINSRIDHFQIPITDNYLFESLNRWRNRHSVSRSQHVSVTDGRMSTFCNIPVLSEYESKKQVIYSICLDKYQLMGKISDGNYGKVLFAKTTNTNKKCAIKMYEKKLVCGSPADRIFVDDYVAKYTPNNVNRSPFLVHVIDILQTKNHYYFVTEFMDYGNLEMVLLFQGYFQYTQVKFYSAGILLALNYLHDQQLIHRNVKLCNVLVDSKGYPRLADFGRKSCISKQISDSSLPDSDPYDSMEGIEYVAPEVFTKKDYDYMVDLWALAVCIVYMLTGQLQKNWKYLVDFLDEIQDRYNSTITNLLKSMTKINPCLRLGSGLMKSSDIFEHPFYEVINWNQYSGKKYTVPVPDKACRTGYSPLTYDLYQVIRNSINEDLNEKVQQFTFLNSPRTAPGKNNLRSPRNAAKGGNEMTPQFIRDSEDKDLNKKENVQQFTFLNSPRTTPNKNKPKSPRSIAKDGDEMILQSRSQSPNICSPLVTPILSEPPSRDHKKYPSHLQHYSPNEQDVLTDGKYKIFEARIPSPELSISDKPILNVMKPQCKIENEIKLTNQGTSMTQVNFVLWNEKVQDEWELNLLDQLTTVNKGDNPLLNVSTNPSINEIPVTKLDLLSLQNKHQSIQNQQPQEPRQMIHEQLTLFNQYHLPNRPQTPNQLVPRYVATPNNQVQGQIYQPFQNQCQFQYQQFPNHFPQQMQNQFMLQMLSRPQIHEVNQCNTIPYSQQQPQQQKLQNQCREQVQLGHQNQPVMFNNFGPYPQTQTQPRQKQQMQNQRVQQFQSRPQKQRQQQQQSKSTCESSQDISGRYSNTKTNSDNLVKQKKKILKKPVGNNVINATTSDIMISKELQDKKELEQKSSRSTSLSENFSDCICFSSASSHEDLLVPATPPLMNKIDKSRRHWKTLRISNGKQPWTLVNYERDLISSKPSMTTNKPVIFPSRSNSLFKRMTE